MGHANGAGHGTPASERVGVSEGRSPSVKDEIAPSYERAQELLLNASGG
jgi:hypothetical protein